MDDADRLEGAVGEEVGGGENGIAPAIAPLAAVEQQELGPGFENPNLVLGFWCFTFFLPYAVCRTPCTEFF